LRIFDENQNPVDMHTSIMCINIITNIKAVAPKGDSRTNHVSISGRTGGKLICPPPTIRRGGIKNKAFKFDEKQESSKFGTDG
jgi:hypothetical protein